MMIFRRGYLIFYTMRVSVCVNIILVFHIVTSTYRFAKYISFDCCVKCSSKLHQIVFIAHRREYVTLEKCVTCVRCNINSGDCGQHFDLILMFWNYSCILCVYALFAIRICEWWGTRQEVIDQRSVIFHILVSCTRIILRIAGWITAYPLLSS